MTERDITMYFLEKYAERVMSPRARARLEREVTDGEEPKLSSKQTFVPTPAEKKIREQSKGIAQWRRWHRKQRAELFQGELRAPFVELMRFLRRMQLGSASALVDYVRKASWIHESDRRVRQEVLSTVNYAICRLREKAGLPPIDDALPGEKLTAFLQIREMLR